MVRSGVIERFVVRVNPAAFGYRAALVLIRINVRFFFSSAWLSLGMNLTGND